MSDKTKDIIVMEDTLEFGSTCLKRMRASDRPWLLSVLTCSDAFCSIIAERMNLKVIAIFGSAIAKAGSARLAM